jgi:hypothetical protein
MIPLVGKTALEPGETDNLKSKQKRKDSEHKTWGKC